MQGTWQTTGGGGRTATYAVLAGAGAAAVVVSWILTERLLIALIGVALLVIAVMVVMVVRRIRHPEGAVQLARPVPVLRAETVHQAVTATPTPAGVHFHGGTHLHIGAGDEASAALIRNSITGNPVVIPEKENGPSVLEGG